MERREVSWTSERVTKLMKMRTRATSFRETKERVEEGGMRRISDLIASHGSSMPL